MKLSGKQAEQVIYFLSEKTGFPTPRVKTIKGPSYDSGSFSTTSLDITLTDDGDGVELAVVIHEWLHYALFLIRATMDEPESDDLEHRFISMAATPLIIGLLCLYPELCSCLNMNDSDDQCYKFVSKILSGRRGGRSRSRQPHI
ncbi:MAG: hypothetical protein QXF97_08315 [Candidatus Caldarchaeum sp.]